MPLQSRYVFSAAMDVEPSREAIFNEVYDTEHVPILLGVPGVLSVARVKVRPLTMVLGGEKKTLAGEHADQAFARAFATQDTQSASGMINRPEERQALDVVPVRMGEQQRELERLIFEFRQQGLAERAQTRARVEDDDFAAASDFDTGSVAANAYCFRSRCRNRTAHTPEFHARGGINETILPQIP